MSEINKEHFPVSPKNVETIPNDKNDNKSDDHSDHHSDHSDHSDEKCTFYCGEGCRHYVANLQKAGILPKLNAYFKK